MKNSELNQFTHKELSSFTHKELSLDKYELLAKAQNSTIILPDEIQDELYNLCTELHRLSPDLSSDIPSSKLKTVGEVTKIVASVISIIKDIHSLNLALLFKKCLDAIELLLK